MAMPPPIDPGTGMSPPMAPPPISYPNLIHTRITLLVSETHGVGKIVLY